MIYETTIEIQKQKMVFGDSTSTGFTKKDAEKSAVERFIEKYPDLDFKVLKVIKKRD